MRAKLKIYPNNIESELDLPGYSFEAVSNIKNGVAILIPGAIYADENGKNTDFTKFANHPILYDFNTLKELKKLDVESNGIFPFRVTDATNVDEKGFFWLLSQNHCTLSSNICFSDPQRFLCLIKAKYDADLSKISFVSKFVIPIADPNTNLVSCNTVVNIAPNTFLIFPYILLNIGVMLVTIKDRVATYRTITLTSNGKPLTPEEYNAMKISSACNIPDGILIVKQNAKDFMYKIKFRSLYNLLYNEAKSLPIYRSRVKITGNQPAPPVNASYSGIEALTLDECNRIIGLSEWKTDVLAFARPVRGILY